MLRTCSNRWLPAVVLLCLLSGFYSCTPSRKLNYFNNLPDSTYVKLPAVTKEERVIGTGDVLDIVFSGRDQDAVAPFNKQVSAGGTAPTGASSGRSTGTNSNSLQGYTVDADGNIELPVLGKIGVSGLTGPDLKKRLTDKVGPFLKEPVVDIRFTNFNITVLGEVRSPGTFSLGGPRTTVFEALAAAGDIPHTAKKYNVHLYRDYNGERSITKIDLTNKSILYNQQVFQMKPNDVLYVQTRKGSIFKEDFGIFASIVSLVVSVVTLSFTISNR